MQTESQRDAFSPSPQLGLLVSGGRNSQRNWTVVSVVAHASVLAVILFAHPFRTVFVQNPGDKHGHRQLLTYVPSSTTAATAALQTRDQPKPKPQALPSFTPPLRATSTVSALSSNASAGAQTGASTDALGAGDITLALVVVHPPPHPDLAQLPHGTRGDVIVDIVIDEAGRVAKSTMVHGLGGGVDQTVLATIQQWTFTPATRNGQPVASEQELLFHYEHA